MNAKETILAAMGNSEAILNAYLADLSDAELLIRPVPGQNHIAWQLGHLIVSEKNLRDSVKAGSGPELPSGFAEAHGRDEASTHADDPERFQSKATYLELMKGQREASKKVLAELTDAEMDEEGPERSRRMAPTKGGVFLLIGTHGLMHAGQFVSVRRSLKKPLAI